jgi:hypothetical protein
MYVRLASAWTDISGAVHQAGDVVDIDVVTLAELEEQGVVEDYSGRDGDADAVDGHAHATRIGPGPTAPPKDKIESLIGPGPTVPPEDGTEIQGLIGPGPTAPPEDDGQPEGLIGPGPTAPPRD